MSLRRLIARGDAVAATSLVQQGALLVSGVGSAWLIGDSGRGQLAYGMTVGTVSGLIAAGGWSPAVALALARDWASAEAVLGILRSVAVRRAGLAALFATVGMFPFLGALGSASVPVMCGAVATAVGLVIVQLVVGVLQGRGLSARANLLRSAVPVLYASPIAVLAGLHFVGGMPISVAAIAWVWTASWSIPSIVVATVVLRGHRASVRQAQVDSALASRMRSYSRASFLGSVSLYELLRADQLVAVVLLSTADLGQYVVASSFTGLMKAMGQALGVSMLSRAAFATDDIGRRLRHSILVIFGAAVVVSIALWPIFHWVLPGEFSGSLVVALILVGASALSAIRRVLVEYAKGFDRPIGASAAEVAFAVGMFAALVSGVVDHSALGIAVATLIGCASALGVAVVSATRAHRANNQPKAK